MRTITLLMGPSSGSWYLLMTLLCITRWEVREEWREKRGGETLTKWIYGEFLNKAVIDGRIRTITYTLNSTDQTVTAVLPHFWYSAGITSLLLSSPLLPLLCWLMSNQTWTQISMCCWETRPTRVHVLLMWRGRNKRRSGGSLSFVLLLGWPCLLLWWSLWLRGMQERRGEGRGEIEEGDSEEVSVIILYQVMDEVGDIQEEERSFLSDATLRLEWTAETRESNGDWESREHGGVHCKWQICSGDVVVTEVW